MKSLNVEETSSMQSIPHVFQECNASGHQLYIIIYITYFVYKGYKGYQGYHKNEYM